MDNPFKDLEPQDSLPKQVKKQTLGNIYTARLVSDMLDLFLSKGSAIAADLVERAVPQKPDETQSLPSGDSPELPWNQPASEQS
ncbi:hypothetical protein [Pontibacter sp. G13]|uniref:hypothetical protein n=1 Tax=Pontibacter sp. G13 TaxID=3074898 RepID=UPI00288A201B|nr:hypothetical protein [Pontibacter sp. G13]WNJ21006.1 hypothetical protein RJD25_11085 [Pontibacter sp. G13]